MGIVEYDLINTPIVDVVNKVILYAAQNKASDIHFDPREDSLMIRMRIDGDLHDHASIPKMYEKNLATRVKLISKMNITETRLPQDGAIKGLINGKDLDMRVASLPTNEGEKIVIRLLDFSNSLAGLESLHFSESNLPKIKRLLDIPSGIILVTGATGSGKSTTTYSMLQALNTEDINIITVEDPVEMNIEGVNQVHVNSEIGMTFAAALRSILREDPDVILIGEMRDGETAQIGVRAAITGHLVLSTIHTNNALATIERLLDMGVERYLLATAFNGIISQKLARTLCNDCKKLRPVTDYEKHIFKSLLNKNVTELYDAVGCPKCSGGFKGRIALHEVLFITEHLRTVISDEKSDKDKLREEVYNGDTKTLLQDALDKVISGKTTFREVYKVVEIDLDLEKQIRGAMNAERRQTKAVADDLEIIDAYDGKDDMNEEIKVLDSKKMKRINYDIKINSEDSTKPKKRRKKDVEVIDAFESKKEVKPPKAVEKAKNEKEEKKVSEEPTVENKNK